MRPTAAVTELVGLLIGRLPLLTIVIYPPLWYPPLREDGTYSIYVGRDFIFEYPIQGQYGLTRLSTAYSGKRGADELIDTAELAVTRLHQLLQADALASKDQA